VAVADELGVRLSAWDDIKRLRESDALDAVAVTRNVQEVCGSSTTPRDELDTKPMQFGSTPAERRLRNVETVQDLCRVRRASLSDEDSDGERGCMRRAEGYPHQSSERLSADLPGHAILSRPRAGTSLRGAAQVTRVPRPPHPSRQSHLPARSQPALSPESADPARRVDSRSRPVGESIQDEIRQAGFYLRLSCRASLELL
jgi:hypothetical protein